VVVRTSTPPASGTLGRCVQLEVIDDGPGIPVDLRDRVFEPYFTTKTKGPERGTGLGLATVFGIVESHGGMIEVAPGLDERGTTMRVVLPAAAAPALRSIGRQAQARTGAGRVLVVDDDVIVRTALAATIETLGYEPIQAANGPDAVTLLEQHRGALRAVLLDMVMPGMSGRATYLALREVDQDIRVALMSGYTLNDEVQEILDLGVRAFLSKPYSVDSLADVLADLMR
jgi:CheY-like chemotaxis protein